EADHDPGDDQGGQEGARIWHVGEQLAAVDLDGSERETNEAAEGSPQDADVADQRSLETVPDGPGPRMGTGGGSAYHRGDCLATSGRPVRQRGLDRLAQRGDLCHLDPVDR